MHIKSLFLLIFYYNYYRSTHFYSFLKPKRLAQSSNYISLLIQSYLIISVHPGIRSCWYGPSRSLAYTYCNTKVKVKLFTFLSMEAVHKNLLYIFDNHDNFFMYSILNYKTQPILPNLGTILSYTLQVLTVLYIIDGIKVNSDLT